MSIASNYDDTLEDTRCKNCGAEGMISDGDFDYICPNCGVTGTIPEYFEEDFEEDFENLELEDFENLDYPIYKEPPLQMFIKW